MPTWPSHFPQLFSDEGPSYDPISNATVIETESGEPMTRLRFTGEMENFSGALPLCDRETAVEIVNYWRYDLKHGTLRFVWDDPITLEAREYLMTAPPRVIPRSADLAQVHLKLMSMPT